MQAIILSIGDELVLGQTIDTNSAWLSQQLARIGCVVLAHMTVADDQKEIERAISESAAHCDCLIVSGGLGPTEDDLTRQALAEVLGQPLELQQNWLDALQKFFRSRGREMPASNRIQAMIPRGALPIHNNAGTALGIEARLPRISGCGEACSIFVVPGVPREMKGMFEEHVLPAIRSAGGGAVILSRTLHTFGLGESHLAEKLGTLMRRGRNPSVGTTVSGGIVSLRVNARFGSAARSIEAGRADESGMLRGPGISHLRRRRPDPAAGRRRLAEGESDCGDSRVMHRGATGKDVDRHSRVFELFFVRLGDLREHRQGKIAGGKRRLIAAERCRERAGGEGDGVQRASAGRCDILIGS